MTHSKLERPEGWLRTSKLRTFMRAGGLVTMLTAFAALALGACESGGVGDPCIPEDEYRENFAGFKLSEENIESRSFQCKTRLCLVNHFQGRVSCPQGQAAPKNCTDTGVTCDNEGEECVDAGAIIVDCDPTPCGEEGHNPEDCNAADNSNEACGGEVCDEDGRYCHCGNDDCPEGYICDPDVKQCVTRVCSLADPEGDAEHCYVPGTNIPVVPEVCAQCESNSLRDQANSVYCSCRCGPPADGESEADENFNFCDCPEGYTCEEIRPNVGLGDAQLAGKYCIKEGTQWEPGASCGTVQGHWNTQCEGSAP